MTLGSLSTCPGPLIRFGNVNFNIVLVNSFKVGSFFSYKDRLPKAICASLVYKFSCATRVAEHAGKSFRTGSILSVPIILILWLGLTLSSVGSQSH